MSSRPIQIVVRAVFAALFLIGAALSVLGTHPVEATTGMYLQETDDELYPIETLPDDFSYPMETAVPGYPEPGATTPPDLGLTPTRTPTPGPSPTAVLDIFSTEDAQMGDSLVTPPPSPTPGGSITPASTSTTVFTPTGTAVAILENNNSKQGFQMDWGFFMIGFVIPVLAGCGLVLYLLDRRPDLFSRRS